ncbi:RES family NAD+ phosphorylase [Algoriphagus jejuensis]|uniref:RES family NAD+ phosphorylase n=1 Tax=Algoriphagus jejuensis TaxID=419934 RepID=A0ABP3Y959_9BACT
MRVFRLSRKKYPIELNGKGAAMSGNRWNSKGTEIVYCAESRALAMAEVVVHLSLASLPNDFLMLEIDIPDAVSVSEFGKDELPKAWNSFPHLLGTQKIGDDFVLERKFAVLKVPSAVVPGDFNYLINPQHPDFSKIQIAAQVDFPFDSRIFK